jgi:acylphosphatase
MFTRYFLARGEVQGVMFRQTLIRAAIKRDLIAGATNQPNPNEVSFALAGENHKIQEIIDFLKSGKPINNWGAKIMEVVEFTDKKDPIETYQVTTSNVDSFEWSPNVDFYL